MSPNNLAYSHTIYPISCTFSFLSVTFNEIMRIFSTYFSKTHISFKALLSRHLLHIAQVIPYNYVLFIIFRGSKGFFESEGINHVFPFFIDPSTRPSAHSKAILLEEIPHIFDISVVVYNSMMLSI